MEKSEEASRLINGVGGHTGCRRMHKNMKGHAHICLIPCYNILVSVHIRELGTFVVP